MPGDMAPADPGPLAEPKPVSNPPVAPPIPDPAVPPDVVPRLFDRFYKGADSRGSGLGLAIARGIVAAHGGEIGASSAPGEGTTIRFTLPRSGAD